MPTYQTGPGHEEAGDEKTIDAVSGLPSDEYDELFFRQPVHSYSSCRRQTER